MPNLQNTNQRYDMDRILKLLIHGSIIAIGFSVLLYGISESKKDFLYKTVDFTLLVTDKEHQMLLHRTHHFYVYGVLAHTGTETVLEMSDYHDEIKSFSMYAKIKVGLSYHFKVDNRGVKFWNIIAIEPFVDAQR